MSLLIGSAAYAGLWATAAKADCATTGLDRTCSGAIVADQFVVTDTTVGQQTNYTIENNTNSKLTTSGTAFLYSVAGSDGAAGGNSGRTAADAAFTFDVTNAFSIDSGQTLIFDQTGGAGSSSSDGNTSSADGGNGGDVNIVAKGSITTHGANSIGIFAQSVGGGGGVQGNADSSSSNGAFIGSFGKTGTSKGTGGPVTITYSDGAISTNGAGAHGIFAQSAGGTFEAGDSSDTKVTITTSGDISAIGGGAFGIFAQSSGNGTGGMSITIDKSATVSGGGTSFFANAPNGAGVYVKGGTKSALENNGAIQSILGTEGNAVIADGAKLSITNNGTITGRIINPDPGLGDITLRNSADATILSGQRLDAASTVNFGTISIGGPGNIATTKHLGDLDHRDSGVLLLDLDPETNKADRLNIGGGASLTGSVELQVDKPGSAQPTRSIKIITADGGFDQNSVDNLDLVAAPAVQVSLAYPDFQNVFLDYQVNFANPDTLPSLNGNERATARHVQEIFETGSSGFDTLLTDLLDIPDVPDYAMAMNSLSAEAYATNELTTLFSMQRFGDSLFSCAERDGSFRYIRQGQCVWLGVQGRRLQRDGDAGSQGFDENSFAFSGGAQFSLKDEWTLGGALGYERRWLNTDDDLSNSRGHQVTGGLVVKRRFNATLVGAALSGGYGFYDVDRNLFSGASASGDQDIAFVSFLGRASHDFEFGNWYLRPKGGLQLDYVHSFALDESGAGATSLSVQGEDQVYVSLQPALEIGGELALNEVTLLRPRVSVGVIQYLTSASPEASARFQGGPADSPLFTSESDLDRTYLDLEAGIDVFASHGLVLSMNGFGQLSSDIESYGGNLRVSLPF